VAVNDDAAYTQGIDWDTVLGLTDYSEVEILGVWCESVKLKAETILFC
jgi:hypothetical protein